MKKREMVKTPSYPDARVFGGVVHPYTAACDAHGCAHAPGAMVTANIIEAGDLVSNGRNEYVAEHVTPTRVTYELEHGWDILENCSIVRKCQDKVGDAFIHTKHCTVGDNWGTGVCIHPAGHVMFPRWGSHTVRYEEDRSLLRRIRVVAR